jgi:hypothetical protein
VIEEGLQFQRLSTKGARSAASRLRLSADGVGTGGRCISTAPASRSAGVPGRPGAIIWLPASCLSARPSRLRVALHADVMGM